MDGTSIKVKVKKISESEVAFHIYENQNGPAFNMPMKEVFMIQYETGEKFVVDHDIKEDEEDEVLGFDQYVYSGPKIGLTFLGQGSASEFLQDRGYDTPLITQFGWQFETRLFTLEDHTTGLLEWIVLAGGVEKGLFLPSASMIFGIRSGRNGMEFGIGPNLSVSGFGMAFAAGGSIPYGRINVPVNLAFIPSVNNGGLFASGDSLKASGFRLSMLVGFNTRVE